jgi:hypothetical protein
MAIVIPFHRPDGFYKPEKSVPLSSKGKVIEFPSKDKRTA